VKKDNSPAPTPELSKRNHSKTITRFLRKKKVKRRSKERSSRAPRTSHLHQSARISMRNSNAVDEQKSEVEINGESGEKEKDQGLEIMYLPPLHLIHL